MPVFWLVDTRHIYDGVSRIYVPIGIGVFVLFTLAILGAAFRYRKRPSPAGAPRRPRNENNPLEAGYAMALLAIAALLLYVTFSAEHREDRAMASERPAVTVDVMASRWDWTFSYPGHTITRRSGANGHQPVVVPVDEAVRFDLRSADVIHGFWIPQLDFKRDAIPGSVQRITLVFDRTGTFSGSCSEYCGVLHSEMIFSVHVVSDSTFRTWLERGGTTTV